MSYSFQQDNQSSLTAPFENDSSLDISGFNVGSNPWISALTGQGAAPAGFFDGFSSTEKLAVLGVGLIGALVVAKWAMKK